MVNRLKAYLDDRPDPVPPEDYYEVNTDNETFYVLPEVADRVVRAVERWWPPRWLEFTDVSGSAVRVRTRLVECVRARRASHRAAARESRRARRQEEKADWRPWEDEDWW
jgi:hypothetical protein